MFWVIMFIYVIFMVLWVLSIFFVRGRYKKYDGEMVVSETVDGGKMFSLELYGEPSDLEFKKRVVFKVTKEIA